jgi:uncharacterized OB-fold protein
MAKRRVPAVAGWFTLDEQGPELLGQRGRESGSVFFPPGLAVSANPAAPFEEREPVRLSRRGRVWSWTTGNYAPPAPYVAPEPFAPYTVVAVELEREAIVVLGQLAPGFAAADLAMGQEMELVLGTLYEDEENEYLVWKWKPAAGSPRRGAGVP